MRKTAFIIISLLLMQVSFSQSKDASQNLLDSISHKVIYYLQNKQADSIYALAGENFKKHITGENFRSISENQIFPLNNFQDTAFVSTVNGLNKYKISGSPDLQLLISLDKENKIETLLIQPFSEN